MSNDFSKSVWKVSREGMKSVALEARVSVPTVSRVVNNKNNVNQATRQRVLDAMYKIGYVKPHKDLIGLIVPDASNPFFSQLGFMFEQALDKQKPQKHLLISSSDGRADRELEIIERYKQFGVEGIIYISSGKSSEPLLNMIADGQIPTVIFDRRLHVGSFDYVATDSSQGTQAAVDYLVAYGHNKIAYLKGLEETVPGRERFESFCEAMKRNKIEINENLIFDGDFTPAAGRTCAELLINLPELQRPTALLAANDVMAIGAMQRLQQAGWVLPKMLSVIGFDDIEWSTWCHPALTTIAQPTGSLVTVTLDLLNKRLREKEKPSREKLEPRCIEIEPRLIPRDSVTEPYSYNVSRKLRAIGK